MAYLRKRKKNPLDVEANLFAAIATMDQLSKYFDKGLVEETLYRRQLKSCISDVFKARMQLEDIGFNITDFIKREKLEEKYPEGIRRLNLVEGLDGESDSIVFKSLKDLPAKSADFVANSIELIDLLKLRDIAKVEYIVPLLDEIYNISITFPNIGNDHWIVSEVEGWRNELLNEAPSTVLPEETREKLEFDAVRWLNEFRRNLKEL